MPLGGRLVVYRSQWKCEAMVNPGVDLHLRIAALRQVRLKFLGHFPREEFVQLRAAEVYARVGLLRREMRAVRAIGDQLNTVEGRSRPHAMRMPNRGVGGVFAAHTVADAAHRPLPRGGVRV